MIYNYVEKITIILDLRKEEWNLEWYIFIAFLLIYLCVISIVLHNNNISIDNVFLKIASLILFIFMSCRAVSVGADTKQYVHAFFQIQYIPLSDLFNTSVYGIGGVRTKIRKWLFAV